jgi:hypothetical protein
MTFSAPTRCETLLGRFTRLTFEQSSRAPTCDASSETTMLPSPGAPLGLTPSQKDRSKLKLSELVLRYNLLGTTHRPVPRSEIHAYRSNTGSHGREGAQHPGSGFARRPDAFRRAGL